MPDVSVIIPLYNANKTIKRALESVFSQTYDGMIEIIVVNDGSTDNSLDIVNNIKQIPFNCILRVLNQKNRGVSSARNLGIKNANSFWICFLDSDDEWLPEKLSIQMRILKNNPQIDFLGCNLLNQEYNFFWKKQSPLMQVKLWELLLKMHPQTSTVIVKKSVLLDVGLYNESMRYAEDGDLWIRICNYSKSFYFSTESLVIYDGGKRGFGGVGLAGNIKKMHEGEMCTLKRLLKNKLILYREFVFFYIYYNLKYFRRKILLLLGI